MLAHVQRSSDADQHRYATLWATVLGIVMVVLLAFIF